MRSVFRKAGSVTLAVVIVVILFGLSGAVAQGVGEPDLGSGWELRLDEPMPVGSVVAGSAEAGFVARPPGGEVSWSPDGINWEPVTDSTGTIFGRVLADR